MKIEIEPCGQSGYEPRAREVQELVLKLRPLAQIRVRRPSGGVSKFELTADLRSQRRRPVAFERAKRLLTVSPKSRRHAKCARIQFSAILEASTAALGGLRPAPGLGSGPLCPF
jgi:hypothetical protein